MVDILLPEGYASYHGIPRRQRLKGFSTEHEALLHQEAMQEAIQNKQPLPDRKVKQVVRLWDALDKAYQTHFKTSRSWQAREYHLRTLKKYMRNQPVTEVSAMVLDALVGSLTRDGYKPASVNLLLSYLSKALSPYERYGVIPRVPKMPRQRPQLKQLLPLTATEEEGVCTTLQGMSEEAPLILKTYLSTGCRREELFRLRVRDVDPVRHRISVDGKTGPRVIPLTQQAQRAIYPRLQGKSPDQRVWGMDSKRFEGMFRKALKIVGITRHFTIHDLRHTFCTRLSERGVSPFVIQKLAGHSNITTTQRYTHLNVDALMVGVSQLEEV
jgi:integrase